MKLVLDGNILGLKKGCNGCTVSEVDLSALSGGSDKDEQTLSINSPNLVISGGNSLDLTPLVKDLETITEIVANGTQYDYTKEDGTIDTIQAGTFISADTGNAIATGTDGGLMLTIPAQLPDDQLLSGDNTGNIDITLTPDVQPDGSIDYLLKADLPLIATTPNGNANALQIDANGKFFVEPETLTTLELNGTILTYTDEAGVETDITLPSGGGSTVTTANTKTGSKILDLTIDGVTTAVNETNTTVTGLQATGKVIGTYNNEAGTAFDIRETITSLSIAGTTLTYTNENGVANNIVLPISALGSYVVLNRTANFSTGGRSLAQYVFNNAPAARAVGNTSLMTLSSGGLLLQPGYRYTINVRLQVNTGSVWTAYMLRVDGVNAADMYLASGFNGAVSANNRMFEQTIVVDVPSSGAAKTVTLWNYEGDSASTWSFQASSSMSAQVVGIL
jgi:hypothetical protein